MVVFFLGLVVGIAAPRVQALYDRLAFRYRESNVVRQIADLGTRALQKGVELRLATQPPIPVQPGQAQPPPPTRPAEEVKLDLPPGWRVVADPPIEYRFDGFCIGGRISIQADAVRSEWRLEPPHCLPRQVNGAQG
jgi:hypothetical protein